MQLTSFSLWQTVFSLVGAATVAHIILKLFQTISLYLRTSGIPRYVHSSPSGSEPWALVTGASDGIGKAFAGILAERGFHVVLHGRNPEKLSHVAATLGGKFPHRSFKTLVADANVLACADCLQNRQDNQPSRCRGVDFDSIANQLRDLNLTVLVNNVGGGDPSAPLHEQAEESVLWNVNMNALFPMHLIRVLLPILTRNTPSLIINISSMADAGFPLMGPYAASKSFLMNLTESVGLEMDLLGHDVEVLGVRVGRVTNVSGLKDEPSLLVPTAQVMAQAALDKVGCGKRIVEGYWAHHMQHVAASPLPKWLLDKVKIGVMIKQRERELRVKRSL